MQIPLTAISIPWNRAVVEVGLPDDRCRGHIRREISSRALSRWRLGLWGPGTGGLSWAGGPGLLRRRGPSRWPRMWWRWRNGANPGMVPPRGRASNSRSRTHGRDALSGGRSRHGGESRSKHDGGNSGCRSSDGGSRARVGAACKGRRRFPHSGSEVVSSARLHHGWVGVGEEMERRGGGEVSEVIWNENEKGRGGGGGLNRWLRAAEELSQINIHKYGWLVVVTQKIWKN